MKRFLLLACLLASPAFAGTGAPREVRVSYYSYGRIHETSADGKNSGFGYDMLELLARKAGWKNRYVGRDRPWSEAEAMIQSGELDVLDCVRKIPGREERYEFSAQPAGFSFGYMLVRTNETRYAVGAYAGWGAIRVGAMENEAVGDEFAEFAATHGIESERLTYATDADSLDALRSGEVDMAVVESMADTTGFRILEAFNPKPYYFCTKKGNRALMDEIDRAMAAAYDENPGWYLEICRKYYPREDVTVYLPRIDGADDVHGRYLRAMSDLLATIGGWNPVFRECAADFSDADFSVPCIAAHVHRTPENLKKFDFPFVPVCRRPVCLLADAKDARFKDGVPRGRGAYLVGYNRHEKAWLKCFLDHAREHNLAYTLVPYENTEAVHQGVHAGAIDLAVLGRDSRSDLKRVEDCGYVEFDFATPKEQDALRRTLDMSVRYMRYHEGPSMRRIEQYAYGITDSSRVVRAGVYFEPGATEFAEDGSVRGFFVDYLREVARERGWDLVFVPMTYHEAFDGLAAGEIDVVGLTSPYREPNALYDLSRRDAGVVRYALKVKADSPLQPNRPDLWAGDRIGYLAGSRPVEELKRHLDSIGAKYRLVPYMSGQDVRADMAGGRLQGFFTVHSRESRDYRTIALFPHMHAMFCTSRRRPEIKRDLDAAMDAFASQNMDFNWWLNNHYLKSTRELMTLDANEVAFVERNRGRNFVVGFPQNVVPVATFDEETGEAGGFLAGLFRLIDSKLDFGFSFTGKGKADVYVVDREMVDLESGLIVFRDWFPLPTVKVSLPGKKLPVSARGLWAVEAKRKDEMDYLRRNGYRVLPQETREDCYRAVAEGRAEATIDNLGSARLMIDENRAFRHLRDSRIDAKDWARRVTIAFPSEGDPELRRLLKKARSTISDTVAEKLFLDAIVAARRGRYYTEDLVIYGTITLLLGVILLGGCFAYMNARRQRAVAEARTRFFFNVSHDIRTPLHAIMGFVDMGLEEVKRKTDEGKGGEGLFAGVEDCLNKAKFAGGLLLSLIKSVLDMSRIEAGKVRHEEVYGDIYLSFVEIEPTLRELAEEKNIALSFDFGSILDRYVLVDYEMCSRIFVNIIGNAIKYTKDGGWVRVRCEQTGRDGRFAVFRYTFEDNGIGMSEKFQKRLYEKFSREKNTTMSGVSGLGLGMAIVKSFVEILGGEIACRSKPGEGTKFSVTLPYRVQEGRKWVDPMTGAVRDADEEEEKGKRKKEEGKSVEGDSSQTSQTLQTFSGKRALLVDDCKMNQVVAIHYLKKSGLAVDTAENGLEALQMVKGRHDAGEGYDIVLMDMQMPVMDGVESAKEIRAAGIDVPIVAWTANAFDDDVKKALAAGMNGHIAKGDKNSALLEALAKFL